MGKTTVEDDPHDQIKDLQSVLEKHKLENEINEQKLYEVNLSLSKEIVARQYLTEINEALQEDLTKQQQSYEKKLNDVQNRFAGERQRYEERLAEAESSLSERENIIKQLRKKIAEQQEILAEQHGNTTYSHEDALEIQMAQLADELHRHRQTNEDLTEKQHELRSTVENLEKNLNSALESLEVKREELIVTKEMLESTQEDLLACRTELNTLKAIPLQHRKKGNSLFAEVDDSRQKMLKTLTALRSKYIRMKEDYAEKDNEIRRLYADNMKLARQWNDDAKDTVNEDARLRDAYLSRISELENQLQKERANSKTSGDNKENTNRNDQDFLQLLLDRKKKEIDELQKKLNEHAVQKLLEESLRHDISKHLRQWRRTAMSLEAELKVARGEIKSREAAESDSETNDVKPEDAAPQDATFAEITPSGMVANGTMENVTLDSNSCRSSIPTARNSHDQSHKSEEKNASKIEPSKNLVDITKNSVYSTTTQRYPVVRISSQRKKI